MKKSLKRRDYHECIWTKTEWVVAVAKSAMVVALCAGFFYRSIVAAVPLTGVGVMYYRMLKQKRIEKFRQQLVMEFRECILAVGTSLQAGYAVENAFRECGDDMKMLFGEEALICQELELIRRGLVINITLEELLKDLAERSNAAEVRQFADVFAIAKRNGGSLPDIISSSAELIGRQIEAGQEVRTLLSGREMEQKVMRLMPFGILIYIEVTYPGYFDSLYHNWQGILVMTICLAVYLVAYVLSDKMLVGIIKELAA